MDYPDGYFDWAGDARRIAESYVHDNPVFVLVNSDGRTLGFYSFTEDDDGLLLDRMFLEVRPDRQRPRYAVLWRHAVQTARELGASDFRIGADSPAPLPSTRPWVPGWYASQPTEEPTWTVQMYRYTQGGDTGGPRRS